MVESHKIINILGLKIKIDFNKNYVKYFIFKFSLFISKLTLDFLIDFILFFKKKNYKIIPLGSSCFSRCISTFSKIKPSKKCGEKTLPFDLAVFSSLDKIIELISNKFISFYEGLEFSFEKKSWINKDLCAFFVHDADLSEEEFKNRYNTRINDFFNYLNDFEKHLYFLIATREEITLTQLENLKNEILKCRSKNDFDIILINQSCKPNFIKTSNVHIINQDKNVDILKRFAQVHLGYWAEALKERKTFEAQKMYYQIVFQLLKIIK